MKVVPSVERSILNPLSLPELSVHARLIWVEEAAVAVRLVGAAGVKVGVGVAVGVGVGLGVVPEICTIFATDGTPLESRMNNM